MVCGIVTSATVTTSLRSVIDTPVASNMIINLWAFTPRQRLRTMMMMMYYISRYVYIYIYIYIYIELLLYVLQLQYERETKYNNRERATNYHTVQHVTLSYCYSVANGASYYSGVSTIKSIIICSNLSNECFLASRARTDASSFTSSSYIKT